jgi:hypothetical protein
LSQKQRLEFETLVQGQQGVRLQVYPSAAVPFVVPQIFDTLEAHFASLRPVRRLTTEIDSEPTRMDRARSIPNHLCEVRMERSATIDALDHVIEETSEFQADVQGSDASIDILAKDEPHRASTAEAMGSVIASLPLRLETFGPLDDMIANLSERPKTNDSLDVILDELWP